ncbi:MAG: hypothetical protein EOO77_18995 [Oxalobacteraceae bacterium]|nr:MAG: hypothetical protein EOO77_18995 [Oxalobacteraceae bacterium]
MLTFLPEWRGLPPEEAAKYAAPTVGETNSPDIRGRERRMPYPPISLRPISGDGEFDWTPSKERDTFFWWCNQEDVWTLAYSHDTFMHALNLQEYYPKEWHEVKQEIYPSQQNTLLHLKHGNASAYTSGRCRGPLCTAAIRLAVRRHRDIKVTVDPEGLEASLVQIGKSFQFYLEFIRVVRNYRCIGDKHSRTDPLRWSAVDKRKTILLDVTDL